MELEELSLEHNKLVRPLLDFRSFFENLCIFFSSFNLFSMNFLFQLSFLMSVILSGSNFLSS